MSKTTAFVSALFAASLLAGCSSVKSEAKYPTGMDRDGQTASNDIYADSPSIFGNSGMGLFGKDKKDDEQGTTGIGVNSFLWRASLDTVSFMPLASADPFGGVILTDWYSAPETPNERIKLNVFILDRQLRTDGIQVKVFKQVQRGGTWHDVAVSDDTAHKLEDAILTRARQLRVAQLSQ